MLFDKNLFESKYVPAEQRTPVDTLILIGNGFDIWQNLDTSYRSFERYYEAHLEEVLERFHLKKYTKYNDDGTIAIDKAFDIRNTGDFRGPGNVFGTRGKGISG